ncbi:transmembrane protein 117 [Aplysia californica]|uniref:Transmembrane protein 117 n=1 Tax=Aplysia californica TaxID=6500 RepID=A0ABM1VSX1_APLCA|nr:transmembrane protein 117 [Aplysia californica]
MTKIEDKIVLSPKSAKSSVNDAQDGGQESGSYNNSALEEEEDCYAVGRTATPLPKITKVEGLCIVESDLPVTQTSDRNNNADQSVGGTEMKKLSRKKVTDEQSLEENKPLKISVQRVRKGRGESMEDDTRMEDINLRDDDGDVETAAAASNEDGDAFDKLESGGRKNVTPAFESAVEAFVSRNGKNGKPDRNKPQDEGGGDRAESGGETRPKPVPFYISNGAGRTDSSEIATKDDVDAGSVYSLFMEKDFRYHFQHPYFRIFTAYFVTFCNFLIYAEDPVAHSRQECNIPVIGNDFSFVCMKWLPNAWSLLKVLLWITGTLVGLIIGKIVFHTLLFNRVLRLKMFHDDKGSWMTMFLSTILFVFIFSYVYNAFLLIGGDYTDPYHISSFMGINNDIFMKAAATGTWCGDFFTAWMVTDMMLQEKLYPSWAKPVRKWWNTSYNRIILFWIIVVLSSFTVLFVIATDYINWDSLNRDFLHSNEISRAFLASFILVLDLTIVMQDWDFPHFISAIDIKLPGLNMAHIRFEIPKLLKKVEYWQVHISGKWFNYGILFIVIILDLNMWKNQIFYSPFDYGQYVDSEGRIHTVTDRFSLDNANESILTFDYRNVTINPDTGQRYILGDTMMNARYNGYSMGLKGMAFVPSIAVFLLFGIFVWIYGRRPKPTQENPYGGRLRKRRRRRFSARKKWNSIRMWFRGAAPVLTRFRSRREERAAGRTAEEGGNNREDVGESRKDGESAERVEERRVARGEGGEEDHSTTQEVAF